MEEIVYGNTKTRTTNEVKLYERFYSKALVNVLVYRREFRKVYYAWRALQREKIKSGKWEEDPKTSDPSIPPDDSDLGPFKEDSVDGPFFNSPIELFRGVEMLVDPQPDGPWWSRCKSLKVFVMQVIYMHNQR